MPPHASRAKLLRMHIGKAKRCAATCGLAVALLSGCADLPSKPLPDDMATVEAGYGRAFGKIEIVEDGKNASWGDAPFMDGLMIYVRSASTGEMQHMQIERDGYFRWPLKPDDYAIVGYVMSRPGGSGMVRMTRENIGRLMTTFSVPKAGQAVYIGHLRAFTGRNSGADILDRYDDAQGHVGERLAAGGFRPVKALMHPEPSTGRYARVRGICDNGWGIVCTPELQGVEPISPQVTAGGFPVTDSLLPRLEWRSSSRPDVTYDVVVFESLWVRPAGLDRGRSRMAGPLVAYAEGLREPRFTPAGLLPGKVYVWSVRLRESDTVSTWSSTSYSHFLLVGANWGSGNYFVFATPSK